MGHSAMQTVIGDWMEAYEMDRDSALLDLISFFIQCSGWVVTAEMCQSNRGQECSDILSKMGEVQDEGSGLQYKKFLAFPWILTVTWPMDLDCTEYPLIQSGPYGRWFHSEFTEFVSVLVSHCQHSVVFDGYLMSGLVSLLTELSDSCVRAFRHTCTLAAVKVLSCLIDVALSLSAAMENAQKLHGVESRKSSEMQSSPRLDKLTKKIAELQEKRSDIESIMDTIFKGVFLKRYRDVLPEIRSICMEELCSWMKMYSAAFLNDSYLKYVGWMMYDKIPEVRLKCVLGLQLLYGDPLLLADLDLFTSRFKSRLLSLTLDRDNEVASQAMKLLLVISKICEDVLREQDFEQLYRFVYSSHRPLATFAGELLCSRLLNISPPDYKEEEEKEEKEAVPEVDVHLERTMVRLRALLSFHMKSGFHKHVVYLVDGLWDSAGDLLKDWPTLTHILLLEPTPQSVGLGLTEAEQAVVIDILVESVRQAAEGPSPVGRTGAKKILSAKERKTQLDDWAKLTEHFLTILPLLLSKFSGRWDEVTSLMKIPQYFQAEGHPSENTQVSAVELMTWMGWAADHPSGHPSVLEEASRAFLCLCDEDTAWQGAARSARDLLVYRWKDRLTSQLEDVLKDEIFRTDSDKRELFSTLRKLRAFYNAHDLSQWDLFDQLSPLLSMKCLQRGVPTEMVLEVLRCLYHAVLWNLHTSAKTLNSRESALAQRQQLSSFCEMSNRCLSHPNVKVKEQRALLTFLLEQVFVGPDVGSASEVERLEDHHQRRTQLAAYCKLLVHGVLEMGMATGVLAHYTKYYNDFGDIIKETLYRTREMDKIASAHADQPHSGAMGPPGVQTFTSIKELARRFALTFSNPMKCSESLTMIHRSGIEFVFHLFAQTPGLTSPPFLTFLTILSEFSIKLIKPDKRTLLCFLQRQTVDHVVHLRDDCWQPLIYYRASLLAVSADGEDVVSYISSDRKALPTKGRPLGSKSQFSSIDSRYSLSHKPSVASSIPEEGHEAESSPMYTEAPPLEEVAEEMEEAEVTEELCHITGEEMDDEMVDVDL
ncbi:hypothetical protein NHX12_007031 [Muraenolepis orangiensis]|uniref:Cohesin subunit SA n=1 Tax=Muraenolepis orangiensis TaxID=630683 RepID=A0A9Q0DQK2_9TELE|nr:hypothetical protein NHX12_007031 [Muraenolepis orangiensis]